MNRYQKVLTVIAMGALFISAANAPWELSTAAQGASDGTTTICYNPIWSPPYTTSGELRLLWLSLFSTWLLIGAVYTGMWFLLKVSSKHPNKMEAQNRLLKRIDRGLIVLSGLSLAAVVIVLAVRMIHEYYNNHSAANTHRKNDFSDLGFEPLSPPASARSNTLDFSDLGGERGSGPTNR
jgi:hypothetical protein